ncbi:MAG: hypothetical protein A2286_09460 [Gammaproteobacteria bacterium RIFOXYA12_FULL_61_12]|nr:MAG: hypothetical protein A2514_05230 [Gammaproteobacteria bacterium RIFOXYD12_FULL_61_37]OGT94279.1 MAG: hypothetical protein A2286_09460 [Gammaproteobacteria bacterium RIFOXYA12_FULL_61_12]
MIPVSQSSRENKDIVRSIVDDEQLFLWGWCSNLHFHAQILTFIKKYLIALSENTRDGILENRAPEQRQMGIG